MVLRLRICNDLLFYDDYRPGFSSAFVVVYGGGLGYGLCVGCGCGVPGCVGPCGFGCCLRRMLCWVVFVLAEGAILYPYFCGIVYALHCFTLMFLINLFFL